MIAFFKRFKAILDFFKPPVPEIPKEEPILYFDRYRIFRNAPLIGKLFHSGKSMFRVLNKEPYKGRWKCELELI